jgi:hypothetical protein
MLYRLVSAPNLSEVEMRQWIILAAMVATTTTSVYAESSNSGINLALPSTPGMYGQDSIRTEQGLDCKNAIGGATSFEFGVTGVIDNYQSPFGGNSRQSEKDVGLYARIVIPLDGPKERINCNSLYELELRKKRIEVLKLQEELEALKRLNSSGNGGFEN